jgi:hypothetical protein
MPFKNWKGTKKSSKRILYLGTEEIVINKSTKLISIDNVDIVKIEHLSLNLRLIIYNFQMAYIILSMDKKKSNKEKIVNVKLIEIQMKYMYIEKK